MHVRMGRPQGASLLTDLNMLLIRLSKSYMPYSLQMGGT